MKKIVALLVVLIALVGLTASCGEKVEEAEKKTINIDKGKISKDITPKPDIDLVPATEMPEIIPIPEKEGLLDQALPGNRYFSTHGALYSKDDFLKNTMHLGYGVDEYREFRTEDFPLLLASNPGLPEDWENYIDFDTTNTNAVGCKLYTAQLWHPRDIVIYHLINFNPRKRLSICLKNGTKNSQLQSRFSIYAFYDSSGNPPKTALVPTLPLKHDYFYNLPPGSQPTDVLATGIWERITGIFMDSVSTDWEIRDYNLSTMPKGVNSIYVAIVTEPDTDDPHMFDWNLEIAWISVQ